VKSRISSHTFFFSEIATNQFWIYRKRP